MPAPETTTPEEDRTRAATRPVLWFSLTLLAALWLSVLNPPWPLPLLSGVFALVAIGLAVVALRRMRRARVGGALLTVLMVLGLLLAVAMVFLAAVQAVMWPVYADFYACLERALTHQAQRGCLADLENAAQNQLLDLLRRSTAP